MTGAKQALSPWQELEAIEAEWESGAEPDARRALMDRPELRADKQFVLDLALAEYQRRCDDDNPPDPEEFCDRFPTFRMSVRRMLVMQEVVGEAADFLACAQLKWPTIPDRLGDLVLLRPLGSGAFGRVYLALEESTGGRPVVLKLSPEGADEACTMGPLAAPGIVRVHWARFEPALGLTAVCMPFHGAATLLDLQDKAYPTRDAAPPTDAGVIGAAIRSAGRPGDPAPEPTLPLSADESAGGCSFTEAVAGLGLQMAEALSFLHAQGVVHRDLKPTNVLLCQGGRALLMDFNLSADARASAPRAGGTPRYMAPEQLRDFINPKAGELLDGRLDLFALGVILYELLTGRHPFGGGPSEQLTARGAQALLDRQRGGFVPLRRLNPAVDRRLARWVERCLAFAPADRPKSAAELAEALRHRRSLLARLLRQATGRPWAAAAAAGLLLMIVGGALSQAVNAEPAHAREYDRGLAAYRAGDYTGAAKWFNRAVRDFPDEMKPAEYYLARGEAELRLGEAADDEQQARSLLSNAILDLGEAEKERADGVIMADIGYAKSRAGEHDQALLWYDKAVENGFQSAGLYNDRGLGRLYTNRVQEAREDFDAALRLDPHLQAALYNRALLSLPGQVTDSDLRDIQRAADLGPASQDLYVAAARLFAAAAKDGGAAIKAKQAADYLQKAIECGADCKQIERSATFAALLQRHPEYKALVEAARQAAPGPVTTPRLVDPTQYRPQ